MSDAADAAPVRWHRPLWLALSAILLLPLIAMQVTREVNWTVFDFVAGSLLLGALGLAVEFILNRVDRSKRWTALGITAIAFFAIWVELATGFI